MAEIIKRTGEVVEFDKEKIINAMMKAFREVYPDENQDEARHNFSSIAESIKNVVENKDERMTVENIQDLVEDGLMDLGYNRVAKAYILYRNERTRKRTATWEMTDLQRDIYEQKYRWNKEDFQSFLGRVSGNNPVIAGLIREKKFLPAGRILAGRGTNGNGRKVSYSNCFVSTKSPQDSLPSIFDVAKELAVVFSRGGGEGVTLKYLRPRGSKVNNSAKESSGAVSFAELYSTTTGLIGQGNRRGALMLTLPISHPDAEEFIDVKNDLTKVTSANISVGIEDDFMESVKNKDITYIQKFKVEDTGEVIEKPVDPLRLFRKIATNAWKTGEPGVLFWDNINHYHINDHTPDYIYEVTNPCGEKPLIGGASCVLSSLNLAQYVLNPFTEYSEFDFDSFKQDVMETVKFMDDLVDDGIPHLPLEEHKEFARNYRNIGLGIMGLGDMLIKLGLTYGKPDSISMLDKIFHLMANAALQQSAYLARDKGAYPAYEKEYVLKSNYLNTIATDETMELIEKYGLRHSEITSIAPAGSISTMYGTSSGIEPNFQFEYNRRTITLNQEETTYKVVADIVKEYREVTGNQDELPSYFVTAYDIPWKERIDLQATIQKYIDSSISSTVNLKEEITVEEIEELYLYAWEKEIKGVTIYRQNCHRQGILTTTQENTQEISQDERNREIVKLLEKGLCPECGGDNLVHEGNCHSCMDCGYSPCAM